MRDIFRGAGVLRNVRYYAIITYNVKGGGDMPKIRPITDLRNTNEISEICNSIQEPIFITKNGYGDLVIMSIATYESMLETASADAAISEAEVEYASTGKLHDAKQALESLRRKRFGSV